MLPTAHAQIQPTPVRPARLHAVTSLFTPMRRVHGGHRKARACPATDLGATCSLHPSSFPLVPKSPPWATPCTLQPPQGPQAPLSHLRDSQSSALPVWAERQVGAVIALGGASTRPDPDARLPHTWCPGQRFAHPPTQGSFLESPFHLSCQPQLDGRKAHTPGLKFQPCPLERAVRCCARYLTCRCLSFLGRVLMTRANIGH